MTYEDIPTQPNVRQAAQDYIWETYGDAVFIPTGTLLQHLGSGSDEIGFQSSMRAGFGIKPLAIDVAPDDLTSDIQTLPVNSVQYDAIALADDHPQACADYVQARYGLDVLHSLPVVAHEVWRLVLANFTEEMTLEMITALFGIKPLTTGDKHE
jgi:hypothetical protein